MNVTSIEKLTEYATEFQRLLELQVIKDDPEVCLNRVTEVENIMVTSSKLLADAKYWQDSAQGRLKEALKDIGTGVSASTLNNWIKARSIEENYLVNWYERINRSATHLCENLRTAISYRKEEMRNLKY